ncbi:MAG: ribonuclease III domain-containing protein [Methanomicrobiaceae archaeon]|nr:ribonuclease III domain-containing protein [Methanomicrobiaceae archaeon]
MDQKDRRDPADHRGHQGNRAAPGGGGSRLFPPGSEEQLILSLFQPSTRNLVAEIEVHFCDREGCGLAFGDLVQTAAIPQAAETLAWIGDAALKIGVLPEIWTSEPEEAAVLTERRKAYESNANPALLCDRWQLYEAPHPLRPGGAAGRCGPCKGEAGGVDSRRDLSQRRAAAGGPGGTAAAARARRRGFIRDGPPTCIQVTMVRTMLYPIDCPVSPHRAPGAPALLRAAGCGEAAVMHVPGENLSSILEWRRMLPVTRGPPCT